MDLSNATLRPGKVLKVEKNNYIKASAPGLFSDEDPVEKLPPIKLFSPTAANSVTSVQPLDEVWILSFNDNPAELYWIRKDDSHDFQEDMKSLENPTNKDLKPGKNPEVVFNKNDGGCRGTIYFSQESGIVIKKDDASVQLKENGDIVIDINYPGRKVEIKKDKIVIGAGSSASKPQPAVLGNNLQDVINKLAEAIATIEGAASKNPYTMQIALALEPVTLELQNISSSILSSNVEVS